MIICLYLLGNLKYLSDSPDCMICQLRYNFCVVVFHVIGYFQHLGMLNQLITLSHQLNSDAFNLTNHKYMTHQTALLYVSVYGV